MTVKQRVNDKTTRPFPVTTSFPLYPANFSGKSSGRLGGETAALLADRTGHGKLVTFTSSVRLHKSIRPGLLVLLNIDDLKL